MSAWSCRSTDGKADQKIVPPRPRIPWWKGPGADSEEKREPASDIDIAVVDSLKALDLKWPIREADIVTAGWYVSEWDGPAVLPPRTAQRMSRGLEARGAHRHVP